MTRTASQGTFTAQNAGRSPILKSNPLAMLGLLPEWAVASPCQCAFVCFASGLIGSGVLALFLPSSAEDDDVRSFTSFAIGACMCCFFMKNFSADVPKPQQPTMVAPWRRIESAQTQQVGQFLPPPGLTRTDASPMKFSAPPGLETVNSAALPPWRQRARPSVVPQVRPVQHVVTPVISMDPLPYTPQTFRKDLMAIMRELASHRNVGIAVNQVRVRGVPHERQAAELTDIITFAVEEARGTVRRTYIAFIAGLTGAFEKEECITGVKTFFDNIYEDLVEEVPKLAKLVKTELVPTLLTVLTANEVNSAVPEFLL